MNILSKTPKVVKIAVVLLMISNTISILMIWLLKYQQVSISQEDFTTGKYTFTVVMSLFFLLYYYILKGSNKSRIFLLILLLFAFQSLFQSSSNLTIDDSYYGNISSIFFPIGVLLLFVPSSSSWFKELNRSSYPSFSASVFRRGFAFLIDILIVIIIANILSFTLFDWLSSLNIWLTRAMGFILTGVYFIYMDSFTKGTFGKRVMWIRLSDESLNTLSFQKVAIRYMIFATPFFFVNIATESISIALFNILFALSIFLIGYLFFVSGDNAQTHYDQLTGAYVVDDELKHSINPEKLWSVNYKVIAVVTALIVWINYPLTLATQNLNSQLIEKITQNDSIKLAYFKKGSYPIKSHKKSLNGKHIQYIAIYILVDKIVKNQELLFSKIAKNVIENYISPGEELYIITMHGYDLGIIKKYNQSRDARTISQWKDILMLQKKY